MDGLLKEVETRLENDQQFEWIELLIQRLSDVKSRLEKGPAGHLGVFQTQFKPDPTTIHTTLPGLVKAVKSTQAKVSESQKDLYTSINKLSKTVDKKFNADLKPVLPTAPIDTQDPFQHMYFSDSASQRLLDTVIMEHLIREGQLQSAQVFAAETQVELPPDLVESFKPMHEIIMNIHFGDLGPALDWANANASSLQDIPLAFELHVARFVSLLASDTITPPTACPIPEVPTGVKAGALQGPARAIAYARKHFAPYYKDHAIEIQRLVAACAYMPLDRLATTTYRDIFRPTNSASLTLTEDPAATYAAHLTFLITRAYCAVSAKPFESPLKVLTDVGGGGALARIAKVRSVMKDKRTNWSATEELPTEIAVPPDYRFHSIFACPVSKEQTTEDGRNPPMMMPCGHVISKESLGRLAKGGQDVKCPYCPAKAPLSTALRVYF